MGAFLTGLTEEDVERLHPSEDLGGHPGSWGIWVRQAKRMSWSKGPSQLRSPPGLGEDGGWCSSGLGGRRGRRWGILPCCLSPWSSTWGSHWRKDRLTTPAGWALPPLRGCPSAWATRGSRHCLLVPQLRASSPVPRAADPSRGQRVWMNARQCTRCRDGGGQRKGESSAPRLSAPQTPQD